MSGLTREARTAARYWANKLRTPEAEFDDPSKDQVSHEANLRIQLAAVIAASADPEAVNRFEAILAHNISDLMSSGAPVVNIARGNVPDETLTRALTEAGIPEAAWEAIPFMTTMVVKVGKVEVQEGIDAPFEEVPLLR